jgi:hypothetical protein
VYSPFLFLSRVKTKHGWHSLGHIINKWRRSLDLEDVAMFDGPLLTERLRIPHTYCWSPALVPKPADWGAHIGKDMLKLRTATKAKLDVFRCLWVLLPQPTHIFAP